MSRPDIELMGGCPTDAEAAALMQEHRANIDTEDAHQRADSLLCALLVSLGYNETVTAWHAVNKWYA